MSFPPDGVGVPEPDEPPAGPDEVELDESLSSLAVPCPSVVADAPWQAVADAFQATADLYAVPVVDAAGQPVGLITRQRFVEWLSLSSDRSATVASLVDGTPLIVDEHLPIERVS